MVIGAAPSTEEICAELVAALVAAELGVASEPRPDHAQYIAHYLTFSKVTARRSSPPLPRPRRRSTTSNRSQYEQYMLRSAWRAGHPPARFHGVMETSTL
jgi:hypothetical protein